MSLSHSSIFWNSLKYWKCIWPNMFTLFCFNLQLKKRGLQLYGHFWKGIHISIADQLYLKSCKIFAHVGYFLSGNSQVECGWIRALSTCRWMCSTVTTVQAWSTCVGVCVTSPPGSFGGNCIPMFYRETRTCRPPGGGSRKHVARPQQLEMSSSKLTRRFV